MKLPFELNKPKLFYSIQAGLAIHDNFLHFIELDEENQPIKKVTVPLAEGCVINAQIKDFELLKAGFDELCKTTGKIREPVSIGLPSGDTVIRLPSFPDMDIEDIRGTLDLNFDEYFPIPRDDAVFDVIRIETPINLNGKDDISVLAAAAKRHTVEEVLEAARKAGIPAGSIEPVNFAMLRSIPEAKEGLCIFADSHSIVAVWEGHGIFFRAANNLKGIQDIVNTIQFVETQYRTVRVSKIILAGLNFQISTDSGLDIVNIKDEYYSAVGLAMAHDHGVQSLDLRPMEFVEFEKRKYSFNPTRLILWGLIVAFFMLSVGTIAFTWNSIRNIIAETEALRDSVSDSTRQRVELAQENSRLEGQKEKTEKILGFLQSDIPALEIMRALEAHTGTGLKFDTATFSRGITGGVSVVLDGKAEDERSVFTMTEGLKRSGLFSSVMLPVSQRDQTGRIVFKVILMVNDILHEKS